jgi:sphingomyelin phosphodiesterase 2
MVPLSLAHRLLIAHAPIKDVWRELHPDSSIGASIDKPEKARGRDVPTAAFNLTENGATCDSVLNTWRWSKNDMKKLGPGKPGLEIPLDTKDPKAKRLDYIFAGDGRRYGESGAWTVKTARVGMTERHPELQCSVSDHFSVETTLSWNACSEGYKGHEAQPVAVESEAFLEGPTVSETQASEFGPETSPPSSMSHLPVSVYDEIIAMIDSYTLRERQQRRWRLSHFVVSVIIAIGCLVAVWWSPRNFVAFLLMLLSTLGLSAGVIDGLIGGLFVGGEIRALKEFEWEIKNARRAAGGEVDVEDPHKVTDW